MKKVRKPYRNPYIRVEGQPAIPPKGKRFVVVVKGPPRKRKAKKKRAYKRRVGRLGGNITISFEPDMFEALEEVRCKMSQIKKERVFLSTIVKMYLEKGLQADKALPRPTPPPDEGL